MRRVWFGYGSDTTPDCGSSSSSSNASNSMVGRDSVVWFGGMIRGYDSRYDSLINASISDLKILLKDSKLWR